MNENITYGTYKEGAYITEFHEGKTLGVLMYQCLLNGQVEKYKNYQKIWEKLIVGENNLIKFSYTENFKKYLELMMKIYLDYLRQRFQI